MVGKSSQKSYRDGCVAGKLLSVPVLYLLSPGEHSHGVFVPIH